METEAFSKEDFHFNMQKYAISFKMKDKKVEFFPYNAKNILDVQMISKL